LRLYLLSSLSRHDNIELIDAVVRRREATSLLLVTAADVSDDSVEDDVRVLGHWTEVLRQPCEERHFLDAVR